LETPVVDLLGTYLPSKQTCPFLPTVSENGFLSNIERRFQQSFPPCGWERFRVLVAVSGGPDSVALVHLLVRSGGKRENLVVAHVNHQLRGADSDRDADFVSELCRNLGITSRIRAVQPLTLNDRNGIEEAARRLRYACLREFAEAEGARYVLTGHTADDQAETILYRLLRGTGLHGLRGIPRSRPFGPAALVRPLLGFRRQELLRYLDELGVTYRSDATNESLDFARNRVRHLVIPAALQVHPAAIDGVLRLGQTVQETYDFIHRQVQSAVEQCVLLRDKLSVVVDRDQLAALDPFLIQEILLDLWRSQRWPMRNLTRRHIVALRQLIMSPPDQHTGAIVVHLPGQVEFRLDEHRMSLRSLRSADNISDQT